MNSLIDQAIALASTGHYLGLAILILSLVQTWLTPNSGFPVTVPARLQPVVAIVLGQAYAVLTAVSTGVPYTALIVHGAIASLTVLLTSHAIWSDAAPAWAQALAFILKTSNDGGTGGPGVKLTDAPVKKESQMKAPNALMVLSGAIVLALSLFALDGCPQAVPVVGPGASLAQCIADDALAGKPIITIVADCATDLETVVVALVNAIDPGLLATKAHAEALNLRSALFMDGGVVIGPGK